MTRIFTGTPIDECLQLRDATGCAGGFVYAAINLGADEFLYGAARDLWQVGAALHEAPQHSIQHRRAVQLQLQALIQCPEALGWVARQAWHRLLEAEQADGLPRATPIPRG